PRHSVLVEPEHRLGVLAGGRGLAAGFRTFDQDRADVAEPLAELAVRKALDVGRHEATLPLACALVALLHMIQSPSCIPVAFSLRGGLEQSGRSTPTRWCPAACS